MKYLTLTALITGTTLVSSFNTQASSTTPASRKTALGYAGAPPLLQEKQKNQQGPKSPVIRWNDEMAFSTAKSMTSASALNKKKRRSSKVNRSSSTLTGPAATPTKDLKELSVGDWITARVAVVTPHIGAFLKTDYKLSTNRGYALLPKSQMKANREYTSGVESSHALPVHAGQNVRVRVIALDRTKGEIAVSMLPERVSLDAIPVGRPIEGVVRAIRSYGAFVDVGCTTNGLLHISRIASDKPVYDVHEALTLGQAVRVRVIGKDLEKNTMEVSMLDAEADDTVDKRFGIQRRRAEV